uniref:Sperm microtubule inner protein 10 n=1 Tax=Laticauda laticaudata TaxID=8630 RepID=A0A8C5RK96_LATLA
MLFISICLLMADLSKGFVYLFIDFLLAYYIPRFIHCHLPRFSCKHGMIPKLYVMPWKQDMKYRALHLQHADQVELYSRAREDTLFLEKSERHCHGEDRTKLMQKVPQEEFIVDIPIYSHLSKYHKSMVAYGFRIKL